MKKQNSQIEQEPKKKKKCKKIALWILGVILGIIIALIATFLILTKIGENQLLDYSDVTVEVPDIAKSEDDGKTVYYNGEKYVLNENITTILGMGIDRTDFTTQDNEEYGANGQADSIFLVALDTKTGKTKIIAISRETMVDIDAYSAGGEYLGSRKRQICLAYSYGDGREFSCENVVKAAERVCYGLPINSYFAINFEAIGKANDAVGGITVNSLADLKLPSGIEIKRGEPVTLHGSDTLGYVRYRSQVDVDANVARMDRQVQYLRAFADRMLVLTKKDISTPVRLYNTISDAGDMVTDINIPKVTYLSQKAVLNNSVNDMDILNVKGETVLGDDGHAEFTPNETEFFEMILSVYYNKV